MAGGGTGGHVTPALALAECIAARGDSVFLLGSERGLETTLVPEAGFDLAALPSGQIMGQGVLARVGSALAMLRGGAAALRILRKRRAAFVVSVGGYASVPAVLAALLFRGGLVLLLCGVAVAYKLAEALYDDSGRHTEVETYLDLVALALVAAVGRVRIGRILQRIRTNLFRGLEFNRPVRMNLALFVEDTAKQFVGAHIGHFSMAVEPGHQPVKVRCHLG